MEAGLLSQNKTTKLQAAMVVMVATAEMTAVLEMVETIHLNSLDNQGKMALKSLSNLKNLGKMDKPQAVTAVMVVMVALGMVEMTNHKSQNLNLNNLDKTGKLHHNKMVLNNLKSQDRMGKSLNLVKAIDHQRELQVL